MFELVGKYTSAKVYADICETEAQAQFLEQCGCDVAQGFFYARPMDVDTFQELRDKNR